MPASSASSSRRWAYRRRFPRLSPPQLSDKELAGERGLSEGLQRILRKAGIDPTTVPGKGIRRFSRRTFHSLRHSFNSALANAGVPEDVRMKLTGHSSKPMNQNYTHLDVATLKNAVTALPMFGSKTAARAESQT